MKDTVLEASVSPVQARAEEVRKGLLKISQSIETDFLDLCDLLREAQEKNYPALWGFNTFGDWVEVASGLEISSSTAYYYVDISKKASALGLTREQLLAVRVSKLREIFRLSIDEHEAEIRALIEEAPGLTVKEVRNRVRSAIGQSEVMYITLKLDKEVKETLDEALELARRNYGSVVTNGEVRDISISKAVELIMVDYCQGNQIYDSCQAIAEEQE